MSGICDTNKSIPDSSCSLTTAPKAGFFDITDLPKLVANSTIPGSTNKTIEYTEKINPDEVPYLYYTDLESDTGDILPIATASAAIRTSEKSYVVFYPSYFTSSGNPTGSTRNIQIVGQASEQLLLPEGRQIQKDREERIENVEFQGKKYNIYIIPSNTPMSGGAVQQGGSLDAYKNLLNAQGDVSHSRAEVTTMLRIAGDMPAVVPTDSFKAKAYRGNDLYRDHGYSDRNLFLTVDISTSVPHRVYLDVNQDANPDLKQSFVNEDGKLKVLGTELALAIKEKGKDGTITAKPIDEADNFYHIAYPTKSFHSGDRVLYFDIKENDGHVRDFSEIENNTPREYAARGDFLQHDGSERFHYVRQNEYMLTYADQPHPSEDNHAKIKIALEQNDANIWRQNFKFNDDGALKIKKPDGSEEVILHKGEQIKLRDLPRTVIRLDGTDHVFNIKNEPREWRDTDKVIDLIDQNKFKGWDEWIITGGASNSFRLSFSHILSILNNSYSIKYSTI